MTATSISPFSENSSKKIIVLEGLDGTGKSALATRLVKLLGDQATLMHIDAPNEDFLQRTINKEDYFYQANYALTKKIAIDPHSVVILDRSWLSGEATRCAAGNDNSKDWPKEIYRPTHLFLLTLPEGQRLWHMQNRMSRKPFTEEEIRLRDDEKYREGYLDALKKGAKKLRPCTIYRKLEGANLSIDQMADKIVGLLDKNIDLLNPRKLTTSDKMQIRSIYHSWQQRESIAAIQSSEHIKITPDTAKAPIFDPTFRARHQCHFDNIGKIFDYSKFAEARHPPVLVGTLENKTGFELPLPNDVVQPQDMPISFPAEDSSHYEYRLPVAYSNLHEFVEKVANTWHALEPEAHKYFGYLSISQGTILPWQAQRRPGIHCDGFQSARISPKELGEFAFVASNAMPTAFYIESFDTSHLDPSKDNFFVAYSRSTTSHPVSPLKSYQIGMMDPYCLHAATSNTTDDPITRTFVRLIYSTRIYDRIGNTHNPAFDYDWKMVRREAQLDLLSTNTPT